MSGPVVEPTTDLIGGSSTCRLCGGYHACQAEACCIVSHRQKVQMELEYFVEHLNQIAMSYLLREKCGIAVLRLKRLLVIPDEPIFGDRPDFRAKKAERYVIPLADIDECTRLVSSLAAEILDYSNFVFNQAADFEECKNSLISLINGIRTG